MDTNRITPQKTESEIPKNFTIDEVSEMMGVSPKTARKWIKSRFPEMYTPGVKKGFYSRTEYLLIKANCIDKLSRS